MSNNKKIFLYTLIYFSKRNEHNFEIKIYSFVIYSISLFKIIDYLIYNQKINLNLFGVIFLNFEFSNF